MQQEKKPNKKYYQVHGDVGLFIEIMVFNKNKLEFYYFISVSDKIAAFNFIFNLIQARCNKMLKCKSIFNHDKL